MARRAVIFGATLVALIPVALVTATIGNQVVAGHIDEGVRDWLDERDMEHMLDYRGVEASVLGRRVTFTDVSMRSTPGSTPLTADRIGCGSYWMTQGFPTGIDCRMEGLEAPPDLVTRFDPTGMAGFVAGRSTVDADAGFGWSLWDWWQTLDVWGDFGLRGWGAVEGTLGIDGIDVALARQLAEAPDTWALLDRLAGEPGARVASLAVRTVELRLRDDGMREAMLGAMATVLPGSSADDVARDVAGRVRAMGAGASAGVPEAAEAIATWVEVGGTLSLRIGDGGPVAFYDRDDQGNLTPGALLTLTGTALLDRLQPTLTHAGP